MIKPLTLGLMVLVLGTPIPKAVASEFASAVQIGEIVGIAKACKIVLEEKKVLAYLKKAGLMDPKSVSTFNTMSTASLYSPDKLSCAVNKAALEQLGMLK